MNEFLRIILYLPKQATSLAREIDQLHYWVIGITMAGATGVALVALWFTFRYRRKREGELTPQVQGGFALEMAFIASLAVIFVTFWVIGFKQFIRVRTPPKDSMIVYVTGKQWMWKFAYPQGPSTIGTLVVPVDRNVKLVMTSRDVIHSFYVPAFRVKHDVLPGRYDNLWFRAEHKGIYKIFCAEYCGLNHSKMWGDVLVLGQEEYDRWLQGAATEDLVNFPPGRDRQVVAAFEDPYVRRSPFGIVLEGRPLSMADRGRLVAEKRGCLACHTLDGQRHIGPTWRGLWGREVSLATGETVRADEAYLTRSMMDPQIQLVMGYPPVMPTYQGMLEPAEVGALLELIRSLEEPLPSGVRYPSPLMRPPDRPPLSHVNPERAQQNRDLPAEGATP